MTAELKILLADDHNVVRVGLRTLIDEQADMRVAGEAADGEAACRLARELRPDVAIVDVSMPILDGTAATERIRHDCPETRVLILTVHEDRGYVRRLLLAGASGYLPKRAAADDLIHAIRAVSAGGMYLDPGLTGNLVGDLMGRVAAADAPALTGREEQILRLIARGLTNKEVAARLDLSIKTVETHRARAMEKLNARGRADIVLHAVRSGWFDG